MKKYLCILAVAALMVACKQQPKKISGDSDNDMKELVDKYKGLNAGTGTFSIEAPTGWTKADTSISGLQAVFLTSEQESSSDGFLENINVVTEKATGYTTGQYFEGNLKAMSTQMPGFEKISSGDAEINGLPAKTLVYSHSYTGKPVDVGCYFFVKNDIGYVVTCTAEKGDYNKWKPKFDVVVNTFKVN
jgi:hypothetical protein